MAFHIREKIRKNCDSAWELYYFETCKILCRMWKKYNYGHLFQLEELSTEYQKEQRLDKEDQVTRITDIQVHVYGKHIE